MLLTLLDATQRFGGILLLEGNGQIGVHHRSFCSRWGGWRQESTYMLCKAGNLDSNLTAIAADCRLKQVADFCLIQVNMLRALHWADLETDNAGYRKSAIEDDLTSGANTAGHP